MTAGTEMTTIGTVLNDLIIKEQDNEFTINKDRLVCLNGKLYAQNEIKIIKTYCFEGESNPSDQAIIYLVIANDGAIGYSLGAYGVYTNHTAGDGFAEAIHNMTMS